MSTYGLLNDVLTLRTFQEVVKKFFVMSERMENVKKLYGQIEDAFWTQRGKISEDDFNWLIKQLKSDLFLGEHQQEQIHPSFQESREIDVAPLTADRFVLFPQTEKPPKPAQPSQELPEQNATRKDPANPSERPEKDKHFS
jgi:hypothetical protein